MAKKKAAVAVAAQAVDTPATLPDLTAFSRSQLSDLINQAHSQISVLDNAGNEEREAAFAEAKKSDKVKALKAELKELSKEYAALLKNGQTVTYQLPLVLTVEVSAYDSGYYGDTLPDVLSAHDYSDVESETLFYTNITGELGRGDLPKDVHSLMQDNLDNVLADACQEVNRLVPDVVKGFDAFAKKVNKFTAKAVKVHEDVDPDGYYSVSDLME
jgi:hypothetical protein